MPGQAWLAGRGASALKVGRAWLGSCCGLLLVAALDRLAVGDYGVPMLIGSFGASAVLLFAAPDSPLSRPRNLLGGHFFSALSVWPAHNGCRPSGLYAFACPQPSPSCC